MDPTQLQFVINSTEAVLSRCAEQIPSLLNFLSNKKLAQRMIQDLTKQLDELRRASRLKAQHYRTLRHFSEVREYHAMIDKSKEQLNSAMLILTAPGRTINPTDEQIQGVSQHLARAQDFLDVSRQKPPAIIFADEKIVSDAIEFINKFNTISRVKEMAISIRSQTKELQTRLTAITHTKTRKELLEHLQNFRTKDPFEQLLKDFSVFENFLFESVVEGFLQ